MGDLQYDEYCADHDTLKTTPEDGIRNDWQGFIDNHVRKEESH